MPADFLNYMIVASGNRVSTDNLTIGGVLTHLQRIKIGLGSSGTYQQDLSFGAATTANSIPVNIASDQIVPVTNPQLGTLNATQPTFGSGVYAGQIVAFNYGYHTENNNWVRMPISSGVPLSNSSANGVLTRALGPTPVNLGGKSTYLASTNGTVAGSASASTTTSIGYLWHPSSNTKRVSLQKMLVSWALGAGSGDFRIALARISAENGVPGGTSQTIAREDQADPSSTCTFRTGATGAPTRDTGDFITLNFAVSDNGSIELTDVLEGKGFVCRASNSEGWEVRVVNGTIAHTSAPNFALTCVWTES